MAITIDGAGTITGISSGGLNDGIITASEIASGQVFSLNGLQFPATQVASANANTLDDYEEGTWTPNVFHVSSNNSTFVVKNGRYIKVGGVVTCWFMCDSGNSGTAGSSLAIGNVPFAITDIPNAASLGIWGANGLSPATGNIFFSGSALIFNGGSSVSTQATYIGGMFSFKTS